jgi:type IV secretion system protein VirB10
MSSGRPSSASRPDDPPIEFSDESAAEPNREAGDPDTVAGERGVSSIHRARSLQSRITNLLAMGLMSALGLGLLGWYYAHMFSAQSQARQNAQAASRGKAQGEMPLPSLGPIDPPVPASRTPTFIASALGSAPEVPPEGVADGWRRPAGGPPSNGTPAPPTKSPEELALERKLSGPAFQRRAESMTLSGSAEGVAAEEGQRHGALPPEVGNPTTPGAKLVGGGLQDWLTPSVTPAVRATVLPTQRLLLAKGSFVDCTLETAIDSTLPGMTTCITATDTFSADGSTVLMERGTKLVGETRGQVQQGSARVFVLWSEARTPTGVVIPLASPGTDELGRSGLSGEVNRHFFQRFGAAILISVISGAVQGAVQSGNNGGAVIYNPSASQDVMTEVLKDTINIPPTVTKANGDRIQVLVARDLDFRSVYELRPTGAAR